jgi:hypothetical protein
MREPTTVGTGRRKLDVLDCNETNLPLAVYDGKSLACRDRTFDVALLVFVLDREGDGETGALPR